MCAVNIALLVASVVAFLGLAVWTGYFTFNRVNGARVSRVPNWVVFGLMGVVVVALLGLALGPCN
jgi:hypothetical protein